MRRNKSKSKNNDSEKSVLFPKSKSLIQFEQTCKEIDFIVEKIKTCDDKDSNRIRVLKEKIHLLENKLDESVANFSEEEQEDNFEGLLKYKDNLLEALVTLEKKSLLSKTETNSSEHFEKVATSNNSHLNLPRLDLPSFYGDSDQWISFKELFQSSILNNDSISDLEKLQYLQACVKGNAAKLIRGFSLQPANLKHCWEILCNRFENKRQLALAQINKIFAIKLNKADDPKSFLHLIDTCNEAIRNLSTLGLESNSLSDLILVNFMLSKLDNSVRHRWELSLENTQTIPDLKSFRTFLEKEAVSQAKIETKSFQRKPVDAITTKPKTSVSNSSLVKDNKCIACLQVHQLFKCPKFNRMNVQDRWKFVKSKSLCENCLRSNHPVNQCRINIKCKVCSLPHHTLLHIYTSNSAEQVAGIPTDTISNNSQSKSGSEHSHILLSTARIKIRSPTGQVMQCKALIDSASQNSLITRRVANELNLPLFSTSHRLIGINGMSAETCLNFTNIKFAPWFSDQYQSLKPLIVSRVTAPLPNFCLGTSSWLHTKQLQLADFNFAASSEVDVLLGADIFGQLITGPPIHGQRGEPCAIPSTLGFLLSGPVHNHQIDKSQSKISQTNLNLSHFFNTDEVLPPSTSSSLDPAEVIYRDTTQRDQTGRYIVKLPLHPDRHLGESANRALKVFKHLENRFTREPIFKREYTAFMAEYSALGHMSLVTPEELNIHPHYFLPHHGVINDHSTTTKLRVVFNASAPTSTGHSLNSTLYKGPKLQSSIFSNLIKFRSHKIALCSDIEKMYRQILVAENDRQMQRIFWRANPSDPLRVYKLNTVTYGTACAPFLALRTIQQLLHDERDTYPEAVKAALDHMYVDDFLGGADSVEAAKILVTELQALFGAGGFHLRKWASNDGDAIAHLPDNLKSQSSEHSFNPDETQRILGLDWNISADTLRVQVQAEKTVTTKRELLSVIARIFDPLGLLSPSTVILKLLLQEVWRAKISWDEPLPPVILQTWTKFYEEIHVLQTLSIPRFFHISSEDIIHLHGFCDASTKAYAAVVYICNSSHSHLNLIAAKTRIAPIHPVTLPRLELSSALLLAELVKVVRDSLEVQIAKIFFWTDSTITLSWILNPPTKGNQFVLHRANKIRAITTPENWHHMPGKFNPADCATRGLYPSKLITFDLWWSGPEWLSQTSISRITLPVMDSSLDSMPECSQPTSIQTPGPWNLLTKFSSYTKLLRVMAWLKRFITNARSQSKLKGTLTSSEISDARHTVVQLIQTDEFATEIALLKRGKPVPNSSKLKSLNPFLDTNHLLRVGGRIGKNHTLSYDAKYPLIIPKNHPVTSAIIRYFHLYCLHGGPELVLSLIRQTFWIPDGRSTVKKELRKCTVCSKAHPNPIHQLMGELPGARVNPCRPFQHVGVDYAGPLNTKCSHKRKVSLFKSYICLFICMCTKAVHIELVSTLSTEAFINSLQRFMARRGCPSDIYSDNGKNFVGAQAYLKNLIQLSKSAAVQDYSAARLINWHFTPPYGPNFGGLWESHIKLIKRHLMKVCKGSALSFEELQTILTRVESCLNSRPLIPLSSEPHDLRVLTPGHFLIGGPLLQLPDYSNAHHTNPCVKFSCRWSHLQQMMKTLWTHWQRDYLSSLNQRQKWRNGGQEIKPGALVLLQEPTSQPGTWILARIQETHPGTDGIVRVVTLRTSKGLSKRPVNRLMLLPGQALPPEDGECGE